MGLEELSGRETEVARVAGTGASTRAIADELCISARTVESHLASIYRKLHVASRGELVARLAADGGRARVAPRSHRVSGLTSPASFVGRTEELAIITSAGDEARAGHRRMVMISGESGAGKSALLSRALDTAVPEEATVLTAQAVEGLAPPFGLITDAVQPFLEQHPHDLAAVVGPGGGILATLLPGLADRLPALPDSVEPNARPRLVADALLHVLQFAALRDPLVLVLEDLHWVDASTIAFLRRLLADDRALPLLVLASFRDTELDHVHALPGLLADLWRVDDVGRITLGGLGVDDARTMARDALGADVSDDFVVRVHEASAGNALFLSQLLRPPDVSDGRDRQSELPDSLRAVVADRLRRAGAADLGPLDVAAVIGLDFDLAVLERAVELAGLDGAPGVMGVLERASRGGLVETVGSSGEGFRFVHDVVRATLVDRMMPARRARVHPAVGRAMAEFCADDGRYAPVIADHLARSHRPEDRIEAGRFAVMAVSSDLAKLAPDEASELAARVLDRLPAAGADRVRLDLLRAVAMVQYLRLDHDAHRAALTDAIVVARRLGRPVDLALAVEPFRIVPRAGTLDVEMLAVVDEAVAGLEGGAHLALRARLVGYAAYQRAIGGAGFALADQAAAAVDDARASGDPAALAMTVYALAAVLMGSPDVARQLEVGAEQVARRGDLPEDMDAADGFRVLGTVHLQAGDREGFEADLAMLREGAERTRSNFTRSMTTMWDALAHLADGDLDAAAAANDALLSQALADTNVLLGWLAQACIIRGEQGRAVEMVALADQTLRDHGDLAATAALACWVHEVAGDHVRASAVLAPLALDGFDDVPDDWLLPGTMALLVPTLARAGTSGQCRVARDRLLAYSGQMLVLGSGTVVHGAADRYLGQLSARLGDTDRALVELTAAVDLERRLRAPLCAAHTAVERARVLISSADEGALDLARSLLDDVNAVAERCGWSWLVERVTATRGRA